MTDASADSAPKQPQLKDAPDETVEGVQQVGPLRGTADNKDTGTEVLSFGILADTCGDELPSEIADLEEPRVCVRPRHELTELHEALDGTTW